MLSAIALSCQHPRMISMQDSASPDWPAPNSKSWRERADRCRAVAQELRTVAMRDRMLNVAAAYDRLAAEADMRELERLERRKRGGSPLEVVGS
jgi:hypothetical protein